MMSPRRPAVAPWHNLSRLTVRCILLLPGTRIQLINLAVLHLDCSRGSIAPVCSSNGLLGIMCGLGVDLTVLLAEGRWYRRCVPSRRAGRIYRSSSQRAHRLLLLCGLLLCPSTEDRGAARATCLDPLDAWEIHDIGTHSRCEGGKDFIGNQYLEAFPLLSLRRRQILL